MSPTHELPFADLPEHQAAHRKLVFLTIATTVLFAGSLTICTILGVGRGMNAMGDQSLRLCQLVLSSGHPINASPICVVTATWSPFIVVLYGTIMCGLGTVGTLCYAIRAYDLCYHKPSPAEEEYLERPAHILTAVALTMLALAIFVAMTLLFYLTYFA